MVVDMMTLATTFLTARPGFRAKLPVVMIRRRLTRETAELALEPAGGSLGAVLES